MKRFFQSLKTWFSENHKSNSKIDLDPIDLPLNTNWINYQDGISIGTIGTEGGRLVFDIENIFGARISLEKIAEEFHSLSL